MGTAKHFPYRYGYYYYCYTANRQKLIDANRLIALLNDPVIIKIVTVLDVVSLSVLELLEYAISRKDVGQSLANEIIESNNSSLVCGDIWGNLPLSKQDIIASRKHYFY